MASDSGTPSWWNAIQTKRDKKAGGGGGGPKPKIKFGKQTARGRLYPVPPKSGGKRTIVKARYFKMDKWTEKRVRAWINYCSQQKIRTDIQPATERSREVDLTAKNDHPAGTTIKHEEIAKGVHPQGDKSQPLALPGYMLREPFFFNSQRDGITPEEASKNILDNVGKSVSHHTLVLSPGDRDIDLKDYTREQMKVLQEALGHQLTWVGNINRDTGADKQHVHVTIAGRIANFQEPQRDIQRDHQDRVYDSKDIDLSRLSTDDKIIHPDGPIVSKFHSQKELVEFDAYCKDDHYIDKPDYQKLWGWIGTKQQRGEEAFGLPPLKENEREHNKSQDAPELAKVDPISPGLRELGEQDSTKSEPRIDYDKIRDADKIENDGQIISKYSPLSEIGQALNERSDVQAAIKTIGAWRKAAKHETQQRGNKDDGGKEDKSVEREGKPQQKIRVGDIEVSRDSKLDELEDAWKTLKPERSEIDKLNRWQRDKILLGEDWYGQPPMLERADKQDSSVKTNAPDKTKGQDKELAERKIGEPKGEQGSPYKSVDDIAKELTGDKITSVQAVKLDAALNRYDRIAAAPKKQAERKDAANARGDVFLTADALAVMREHGDYYLHCMRTLDRTITEQINRDRVERIHVRETHPRLQGGLKDLVKTKQNNVSQIKAHLEPGDFLAKDTERKVKEIISGSYVNGAKAQEPDTTKKAPGADMVTQGNAWKRLATHLSEIDTTHSVKASEKAKEPQGTDNRTTPNEQPEPNTPKNPIQRSFPQHSDHARDEGAKQPPPRARDHKGRLM